jgi:pyruvate/2-oxoglutarate dehydrogenase complex dihydrolipoamide dehydrogenase (E3) component
VRIPFDAVLVAVGRVANLKGYGLEEFGIRLGRTVDTNEFLQTNYPNIYAAGDVAGPYQFTHTAAHQAWYAAVNALFDPFKKVQGRLLGDPLGHLHRAGSGARRPQRAGGEGEGHRL